MTELRPGYNEAILKIGRRAAEKGFPIERIDERDMSGHSDRARELWRIGWRQYKYKTVGLTVVK